MNKMMKTAIALALIAALWAGHMAGMAPAEEIMAVPAAVAVPEAARPALAAEAGWQAEPMPAAVHNPIVNPVTETEEKKTAPEAAEETGRDETITVQGWVSGQIQLPPEQPEPVQTPVKEDAADAPVNEKAPEEEAVLEETGKDENYYLQGWVSGQIQLPPEQPIPEETPAKEESLNRPLEGKTSEEDTPAVEETGKDENHYIQGWLSGQEPVSLNPAGETREKEADFREVEIDTGYQLTEMP